MSPRFLVAAIFIASCVGASPAQDLPSIDKLVEQLGSKSFPERERASKALRERGPAVLTALRKALESKDEEVRKRAEVLIPPLEIDEALLPKRVSIKLDDQPLSEAIKQLEKQTGYRYAWLPLVPGTPTKWTLDLKDVSFWEAIDRLGTEKDRIVCIGNGRTNMDRDKRSSPHFNIRGPFRLDAGWLHEDRDIDFTRDGKAGFRDSRLTLSVAVMVEPRITFTKIDPAKIDEAIDSDGKSLLEPSDVKPAPTPSTTSSVASSGRGTFRSESLLFSDVRLKRASESAKTIKLLRGTIPIKAIVIRKPVAVTTKVLDSAGTTFRAGTETIKITRVITQGGANFQVELLVPYEQGNGPREWHERFHVEDDAGNKFQMNGRGTSSNGREYHISMYFAPLFNKKDVGPPTKLIFEDWIVHDYAIPFEFKDLPLP